jgi:ABC transporter substrate binding protein
MGPISFWPPPAWIELSLPHQGPTAHRLFGTPGQSPKETIPIVFTIVPDPVGAGFVDSLSRPGGNATGFSQFEYGLSGKWLELLKEIALTTSLAASFRARYSNCSIKPCSSRVRGSIEENSMYS